MTPLETPSGRAEFDGFPAYYEAEIAPFLGLKERERRAAVTNFFILVVSVGLFVAAIYLFAPFGQANAHLAFAVAMLGLGGALWLLNRTRNDIAEGLLQRICGRLSFTYRREPGRPFAYDRFRSLGLLPNHNRESWEDEVAGQHAGAPFRLCEAHLRYKTSGKNSSTRTVFHGQLLVIDYPKRFLGTTVVKRDLGAFNAFQKPGSGFSPVRIASPEFEKAFEAWSTDQVEARDLLDPVVLERFQELERLFGGKKLRAAFAGGELLIAVETGDRINIGSMFKPLEDKTRVETILKEFAVVFDLIDVILKRAEGRLVGPVTIEQLR